MLEAGVHLARVADAAPSIACILTFNNLMVVGITHIPWFSYGLVALLHLSCIPN